MLGKFRISELGLLVCSLMTGQNWQELLLYSYKQKLEYKQQVCLRFWFPSFQDRKSRNNKNDQNDGLYIAGKLSLEYY